MSTQPSLRLSRHLVLTIALLLLLFLAMVAVAVVNLHGPLPTIFQAIIYHHSSFAMANCQIVPGGECNG